MGIEREPVPGLTRVLDLHPPEIGSAAVHLGTTARFGRIVDRRLTVRHDELELGADR